MYLRNNYNTDVNESEDRKIASLVPYSSSDEAQSQLIIVTHR